MSLKTDYVCLSKNKCLSNLPASRVTSGSYADKYKPKFVNKKHLEEKTVGKATIYHICLHTGLKK